MTRIINKRILLIPATMLTIISVSCQKVAEKAGCLSFEITGGDVVTDEVKSNVSDYTVLPAKENFTITIENSAKETAWTGALSEWNSSTTLPAGNYSVSAAYGSVTEEGPDKPCFGGNASFAVTGGGRTTVSIPVSLQNCIVKFTCTEAFRNYFTDYSFTVETGAGNEFTFDRNTEKAVFIDAYRMTVSGQVTSQGGQTSYISSKVYGNLEPATCYTLKMDASNIGGLQVTISFNNTVGTVDLGEIEMND